MFSNLAYHLVLVIKNPHLEATANNFSTEDTKVRDWYSYTMNYDSNPT